MGNKGFTVIEGLIVLAIIATIVITAVTIYVGVTSTNYCENYRYVPIKDTPASCVEYLTEGE